VFNFGSTQPVVGRAAIVVGKPVEAVFAFMADGFFENYPRWSPEVVDLKRLSEGPLRVGTIARQVRVDQGHRSESTFRISDCQFCKRLRFTGISNPFKCTYEFERTGDNGATRVTFIFELIELELYIRPFEKLVRVSVQDGAQRTVKNIKRLIEATDNFLTAVEPLN
jgi:hypothetical protein